MSIQPIAWCLLGAITVVLPLNAQQSPAPDFIPDYLFEGSTFSGWQPLTGSWEVDNGRITGRVTSDDVGAWLASDEGYQNLALFSRFRCSGPCDAGILMRAEQTPTGWKGIFVAIEGEGLAPYRATLDSEGRFTSRTPAFIPPVPPPPVEPGSATHAEAIAQLRAPVQIEESEWNSIEIFLDANQVFNHLNNVRNAMPEGRAQDLPPTPPAEYGGSVVPVINNVFGYGPIGIYVGSGQVEFEAVALKDLNRLDMEAEKISDQFSIQKITDFSYSWGADVADINNDGEPDFIAGPFYYLGPGFLTRYEFYEARVFNPGLEYVNDMITFANDWDGDGWPDILLTERRAFVLYANPKGEKRYWDRYEVLPTVCGETAIRADVDGDGALEVAFVDNLGRVSYGEPNPDDLHGEWLVHNVSEQIIFGCNAHGLGVGDVNGDGRQDILQARGWWEQPAEGPDKGLWIHHDDWFGRITRPPQHPGGAEIVVYDFNGDGLNDVVATHSAHGWGMAWYEQHRDADGMISFTEHMIMGDFSTKNAGDVTFSQAHSGATLADIDGDGIMDFVTGKRHWSHLDSVSDPDPDGEAVVYWYRTVRNPDAPGGVEFVPELIHNKSGVGSEVKVLDVNEDGKLDIVTSGTRGAFILWGK